MVAVVGDDDGARRGHRDTARLLELGDGAEAVGEARGAAARQRRDGPACTRTRTCVRSLGNVCARVRVCVYARMCACVRACVCVYTYRKLYSEY
jgi:hypothetical protein